MKKRNNKDFNALVVAEAKRMIEKAGGVAPVSDDVSRYGFNFSQYNNNNTLRKQPSSSVSFDVLRRFSVQYPIARAAINARKRQITQLGYEFTPIDGKDKGDYTEAQNLLEKWFKYPAGNRIRFPALIDMIIEDLLVLDAISLHKRRNAAGDLLYLTPIDAATIVLRLDQFGNTPAPPEVAYRQVIRGEETASFTTDDLIYDMMNPRSSTPYGLAPIESLILTISSALKSDLYNLSYLSDGNTPEGFYKLPADWSNERIKTFQEMWDGLLAGDARMTRRMKFMPGGQNTGFEQTKKPSDMAFKEFNTWLMEVTCAVLDVQPQEIGFTGHQSTRANAHAQDDITQRRGILPLANFISTILSEVVQQDLGFPQLQFQFLGLEDRDETDEVKAITERIQTGYRTVDEERINQGLDPFGINYPIFMAGSSLYRLMPDGPQIIQPTASPTNADDATAGTPAPGGGAANEDGTETTDDSSGVTGDTTATSAADSGSNPGSADAAAFTGEMSMAAASDDLRKLKKYAVGRVKEGKSLRKFESKNLPADMVMELNQKLAVCKSADQVKSIITEARNDLNADFIANVAQLRTDIAKVL